MNDRAVDRFKLIWTKADKLGSLVALLGLLLFALGFRIEKPGERFEKIEAEVDTLARDVHVMQLEHVGFNGSLAMLVGLKCLELTTVQAVTMNVCKGYKTADDTARNRGR